MVNKVILIGNVGADPEVRTLESGVKVATVRLATTERIFNRQTQETTEHTEWHRITMWRGTADVVDKYIRKGSQIYVEGRIRTREWSDESGVKRYSTEIIADEMKMLGRRNDSAGGGASMGEAPSGAHSGTTQRAAPNNSVPNVPQSTPMPQQNQIVQTPVDDPDDLPF